MIGDGQVSLGNTVCKGNAMKVRRLGEDNILVGMAGFSFFNPSHDITKGERLIALR